MAGEPITPLATLPELADELGCALQHRLDLLALFAEKEALFQDKKTIREAITPGSMPMEVMTSINTAIMVPSIRMNMGVLSGSI